MNSIQQVFPYVRVRDATAAIEPSGRIGHAEIAFGEFTVMLSDEYPEYGIHRPEAFGGTDSSIHLHVEEVDALTQQAVGAGAELIMLPTDQFYGERSSKVSDPFGHEWLLGSQIEELTQDEIQHRFTEMTSTNE